MRRLASTALALLVAAGAASGGAASTVRLRECGLPAAGMTIGPKSFTRLWQASRVGWTGGDAALSARLPDGRFIWVFGDSFLGGMNPDGTRDPNAAFVRNSVVIQDRDCLTTLVGGTRGAYDAYLPAGHDPGNVWYWPNQPLVRGRDAIVFLTRIVRTGPGGWDFAPSGSAIARLRLPNLAVASIRRVRTAPHTYFGSDTIVEPGGPTFVFGVDERRPTARGLLVARVTGNLTRGAWVYWDGYGWTPSVERAAPIAPLPSSQFSVMRYGPGAHKLQLVVQDGFASRVRTFFAPAPEGPWIEGRYMAGLPTIPGALTYNATAHGEFHRGTTVLVSYCVNTYGNTFDLVERHPELYRPRFLSVNLPDIPRTLGGLNPGPGPPMQPPGGAVTLDAP